MNLIYETNNFEIIVPNRPHISREDGGHIIIAPKTEIEDRVQLSPILAKELMKLTMVAGEALKVVMNKNGVDVGRINYQDNGNWNEHLHIHIYGRANSAKLQKYGTPLMFPATIEEFRQQDKLESLNEVDLADLRVEIEKLLQTKYKDF